MDEFQKRRLDEITHGVLLQVTTAIKNEYEPEECPGACLAVFLAAYVGMSKGAPPEAREMIIELIDNTTKMLRDKWNMPEERKEQTRLILPFN